MEYRRERGGVPFGEGSEVQEKSIGCKVVRGFFFFLVVGYEEAETWT